MTADKRKRLNSVRFVNNPISKPSSDREKAVQVGRSLTVSRGRPTFCLFCKVRHSTLACPLINPVNSTTLPAALPASAYQTRPPPTDPRTLQQKTRRCKRCRSQPPFIVEGILVERTLLCDEHNPGTNSPDPATDSTDMDSEISFDTILPADPDEEAPD